MIAVTISIAMIMVTATAPSAKEEGTTEIARSRKRTARAGRYRNFIAIQPERFVTFMGFLRRRMQNFPLFYNMYPHHSIDGRFAMESSLADVRNLPGLHESDMIAEFIPNV
jgi:hypothetical protein